MSIQRIDDQYKHIIKLKDGFVFAVCEPYCTFEKYINRTPQWSLNNMRIQSMTLMEQITLKV